MHEIGEAEALLTALAGTDEVKVDAVRRRHRRHLHVAYGNALIAACGPGARERTADYGLWARRQMCGDLSVMRVHAETFLGDVEARPHSLEAGTARRVAGVMHWFTGEYVEARESLERAPALFQPRRDDDLAFRFGHDEGGCGDTVSRAHLVASGRHRARGFPR
jgi:hypothetical protein